MKYFIGEIAFRIAKSNEFIPNPFPSSLYKKPVFHGSFKKWTGKFNRPQQGIWFTEFEDWASDHYTGDSGMLIPCYVDVRKVYTPTDEEFHKYYGLSMGSSNDPAYKDMAEFFKKLESEGYDAYYQGGESESFAVFKRVPIVNAITGQSM